MVCTVPGATSSTGSLRCQVLNSSPGEGALNKAALVWEKTKEEGPFLSIPQPVVEALAKPSPTGSSPTASRLSAGQDFWGPKPSFITYEVVALALALFS